MTKIIPLQLLESTAGWLCLNNSVLFDNTCKCIVISLKKYGRLIQHCAHNCGTDPNIITVIITAFVVFVKVKKIHGPHNIVICEDVG